MTCPTYELIRDDFLCESGGAIMGKGKGPTDVWYVLKEAIQPARTLHQEVSYTASFKMAIPLIFGSGTKLIFSLF